MSEGKKRRNRPDVPPPSSPEAHHRMRATRQKGTKAEERLKQALEGLDVPFDVDVIVIPGLRRRADFAFAQAQVAVFVDGCFWHGCPIHGTWPKQNAEFWRDKIETNRRRDADTDRRLAENGWASVRVWEHEDMLSAAERILDVVVHRQRM